MDRETVIEETNRIRERLHRISQESDIPAVVHAAHQADVHCHGLLWELGAETATTPELDEIAAEEA